MAPLVRNSLALALCALVSAVIATAVQLATRDRIAAERSAAAEQALLALLPASPADPLHLEQRQAPADANLPGREQPQTVYIARRGDAVAGVILPVIAPRGYGGPIRMLAGIDTDGRVTGVRVLAHRETPGLGDRIEPGRSDWLRQFQGQSLGLSEPSRWAIRRDQGEFDQITGATITSRAVVTALREALQYFGRHRAELLGETNTGETNEPL